MTTLHYIDSLGNDNIYFLNDEGVLVDEYGDYGYDTEEQWHAEVEYEIEMSNEYA